MRMWGEAASPWMAEMAKDILGLLDTVYPGHPWKVHVYGDETGGGYHIRHLEFDGKPYGMNQPNAHMFGSASEFRADVIRKGGEILERVALRRGRRDEAEQVTHMEGVPLKHQPIQYQEAQKDKQLDQIVKTAIAEGALRTEPMPQVKEAGDG